jgi:hypothetical protein
VTASEQGEPQRNGRDVRCLTCRDTGRVSSGFARALNPIIQLNARLWVSCVAPGCEAGRLVRERQAQERRGI